MPNQPPNIIQPCPICGETGKFAFTGKDLMMGLPGEFNYAACSVCETVYQTPTPDSETITSFYPETYEPYQPSLANEHNPLKKAALRATYGYKHLSNSVPDWIGQLLGATIYRSGISYKTDGRLLDIGCGGGKFLLSMQRLGWQAEGVEFNPSAVKTCKELGLEVFQGDLTSAAFPDNQFDVVTARQVIEHIPTPKLFITEIFRILKPGGLMILITPNSKALGRNWFGTNWFANEVPRHLFLFAPKNLSLLATQLGFQEKAMYTSSTPKIILNSWDYLTHNKGKPSKRRKIRRFIARAYVLATALTGRGDKISSTFQKPLRNT